VRPGGRLRAVLPLLVGIAACGPDPVDPAAEAFTPPPGFPELRVPDDNPLTPAKVELGRHLFYDPRLSGNGTQSCASCHHQDKAFSDGRRVPEGSTGQPHVRNANALTNVGYNSTLTWANPALTSLEQQILVPLFGEEPVEMAADDASLARIEADPLYRELFAEAFPDRAAPIDWDGVVDALASFNRVLVSGRSPFDRYTYDRDADALSDEARRGLALFYSERLECHHCHGGFNFTEASVHEDSAFDASLFHNTGLYNLDGEGAYPANNPGILEITGEASDMGRFRAPSLRNVEVTAPYMHDGSMETLEEVIHHYERGGRLIEEGPYAGDGRESPLKSGLVAGFSLTDQERADLVAFLESLTDEDFLTDPALSDPFLDGP